MNGNMEFNIIKWVFIVFCIYMLIFGLTVLSRNKFLPKFLESTFEYGKFRNSATKNFLIIEVPKSWFKHFYIFAILWLHTIFAVTLLFYLNIIDSIPVYIKSFISFLSGYENTGSVSAFETLFALVVLSVHICKRYYETHHVSIFSDSKMHFIHYFLGMYHYFCVVISIVMDSPGYSNSGNNGVNFHFENVSLKLVFASLMAISASLYQLKMTQVLANLRKNKKGEVVTKKHLIPHGGMFSYVSCPHNTCEIIFYLCLAIMLNKSTTTHYVFYWVAVNQTVSALFSHKWYKDNFKDYPLGRKAVIPFVL